ncbi:MAG TPA: GAF domain-containing protein [Candidatus Sulfomarinibacteraceae bacterium]|nr:GAF domain-containing protein [Candidatus Sulfomarinibacteraceae bacterium]
MSEATRPQAVAALREIARALSTAWDLDTSLDLIARKTTEVMQVDSCSIYLLDPDGRTLRLRATTGLARKMLGRATLQVGEGMTGHAVAQNRPIFAGDAQHNPHFKWVPGTSEGAFHSLLAAPLVIEDEAIGALNVQTVAAHEYTPREVEIVSLIADLAAGALAKAQLYDSQKRQIAELQALAEVSEVVTSPQYLDDILDVVTEMASKLMEGALCSIFLLDEAGQALELRSARHAGDPYRNRPPLPLGKGVIGRVATSGQPAYVRDVRQEPAYLEPEMARKEGLVSLLSVPLSVRDHVIGVFNCYSDRERAFSQEQKALFLTLANQTALAIEHARLATNAAMVREMHHRIKNNLQTVAMLMQLQLSEAREEPDARQVLQTSMNRIYSIAAVHEVLSERGFHLVDVKDVLQRIARMTTRDLSAPQRQLAVSVEGEALLLPSRVATNLALVVNELAQNALEHAFAGRRQGRVQITLASAPSSLLVTVRDDGSGLPQEFRAGLGTEIVQTLVREELRGEMSYRRLPRGTEVTIRVPRQQEVSDFSRGSN